ncbi:MAG: hypothetical protein UZ05_CHB002000241 [Chlorobi bacterium OLB5]|nr:MAG: hypothetical protein UZ05_CHB002000241 [Chlorobi bacterium OLB5]
MTDYKTILVTAVFSFLVGFLLKLIKGKSRVYWWNSHNFLFTLPNDLLVYTNAITVKNFGTKTADKIQIAHHTKPEYFKIYPALPYIETITPQNEHIVEIDNLAANQDFTIEFLSLINAPQILYIKSIDGYSKLITKPAYPTKTIIFGFFLITTSFGTAIYWLIYLIRILLSL